MTTKATAPAAAVAFDSAPADELTTRRRQARRLFRNGLTVVGLAIIGVFALIAILAPLAAPRDPIVVNPARRLAPPSVDYWLGTDNLGRDTLSRLIHGARWSLGTVTLATLMILTIGVSVGAVAGYFGGWWDQCLMRLVDTLLAFPSLILALAITGTLGPGIVNLMLGLVSVWWVGYARVVRGVVLTVRERQYVEAARCLGGGDHRILWRHVLPNVVAPVLVLATLELGSLILAISGLSFLGLGAQPPTPEWGAMLNDGRPFLISAPQLMIYPGLTISLVVIGFNLLGDGLRDALDPRR